MSAVVLLAHGSPDPRSGDAVRRTAKEMTAHLRTPVVAAFLDHEGPGLAAAVDGIAGEVVVLPLLLSSAFHARVDVPAAVALTTRPVTLLAPLGHPPALLDELLLRATGPAVVVAAGTRIAEERDAFGTAVAEASRRTGVSAVAAYATGVGLPIEGALVEGAVVVPWLLAPGRLLDSVLERSRGHRVIGAGLLLEPTLRTILVEAVARGAAARRRAG